MFLRGKARTAEEERIGVTRESESLRLNRTITRKDWAMRRALEDEKNGIYLSPDEDFIKMEALFDEMERKI